MSNPLRSALKLYKDAYSGHPKEVWVLAVLTLINRMGMMVLPFLSVYLTTILGFSLKQAGLIVGAFGLGSLAGAFLAGRISDRLGPRSVILTSLLVSGFLLISLQFATAFGSLFFLIFITAFFGEAYRPALMASIGDYVPKAGVGRSIALIRLAINLGMTAAPAIGGFVAVKLGYDWLFWIDGLTCIVAALYFWRASQRWEKHGSVKEENSGMENATTVLPPYKNRPFLLFLLASFLAGFAFMQWFHSVPVFLKSEWGFDERYIGTLLAFSSFLVVLIEMPVIHLIEKAQKIKAAILGGVVLIGVSFLPFLLPSGWLLGFFAVFLLTMGEILFLPLNNSRGLNMSPAKKRGEYMSWYWMAWSLTNILGPTVGLTFADQWGFSALWVALAGMTGLSLWLNLRVERGGN